MAAGGITDCNWRPPAPGAFSPGCPVVSFAEHRRTGPGSEPTLIGVPSAPVSVAGDSAALIGFADGRGCASIASEARRGFAVALDAVLRGGGGETLGVSPFDRELAAAGVVPGGVSAALARTTLALYASLPMEAAASATLGVVWVGVGTAGQTHRTIYALTVGPGVSVVVAEGAQAAPLQLPRSDGAQPPLPAVAKHAVRKETSFVAILGSARGGCETLAPHEAVAVVLDALASAYERSPDQGAAARSAVVAAAARAAETLLGALDALGCGSESSAVVAFLRDPLAVAAEASAMRRPHALAIRAHGARTVHFVRHGQGNHNLPRPPAAAAAAGAGAEDLFFDAPLNPAGRAEVAAARAAAFASVRVDVVLVSPLTRALETAAILFPGALEGGGVGGGPRILALDLLREAVTGAPENFRRPAAELAVRGWGGVCGLPALFTTAPASPSRQRRFSGVDFSGAVEDLASRPGAWPESLADVARRGAALLACIRSLPEPAAHVAVVSHGVFLETLLAGGDECAAPLACDERHRAARWCARGGRRLWLPHPRRSLCDSWSAQTSCFLSPRRRMNAEVRSFIVGDWAA